MDISVIIVNFKSRQFLPGCLFSLQKKLKDATYEVIIVNNDEQVLEESSLEGFPVKIINTSSNLGFAKACNAGAKIAIGNILFFLNPDTEIIDLETKSVLEKLSLENIGIVAPKIMLADKSIQSWSAGKGLTLGNLLLSKLGLNPDISPKNKDGFDWVSGAAFLITKSLFFKKDGFDEKFFMYFEDMDLCLRVKSDGFKIIRLDDFSILHIGGQSYTDNKLQKEHYYLSQDYYFKKHFGSTTAFLASILRKIFLFLK